MIEITLLKCKHAGKEEARKLLPYIQNSDVFAPEAGYGTEDSVAEYEEYWESILSSRLSRTRFNKENEIIMSKRFGLTNDLERRKLKQEYGLVLYDYLFRNRVLLWHVERFSKQEAEKVIAQ